MSQKDLSLELSDWLSTQEGKLSVDVIETRDEIIVRSAIAGVKTENLDITLLDDTLTIRGVRHHDYEERTSDQIHVQECHWGSFSRTVILPNRVDSDTVEATLKQGILTIKMKKKEKDKKISVLEIEDL
jgi:HSP20 family protein